MNSNKKILSSFTLKKELNPKIWDFGVSKKDFPKMKNDVRDSLIDIAYEFIEFIGIDVFIEDIVMTGSLANYNWSNYSDVDLHLIVNYEQFSKEQVDLYKELFNLKKIIFNNNHDITIKGYDVELYAQDSSEPHFSTGEYSVLYNEWLKTPKKESVKIDKTQIENKANEWMDKIDGVINHSSEEDLDTAKKIIKKYKDKLKKYRTSGLEKEGEYSNENLVFKLLRRNGYIEKLIKFQDKLMDKKLSIENKIDE